MSSTIVELPSYIHKRSTFSSTFTRFNLYFGGYNIKQYSAHRLNLVDIYARESVSLIFKWVASYTAAIVFEQAHVVTNC